MGIALLITDGDCGFCQRSADWLQKHFPGQWVNAPSQTLDLAVHGLTQKDVDTQVWLLIPDANGFRRYGGAKAVAKLLFLQPKFYIKPIAIFAFLPMTSQIAHVVYRWVAKNRSRFNSSPSQCDVPRT